MINRIYEKIINYLFPLVLIIPAIPFSTINAQDESLVENIKKITVQLTSIFPNGTKDYGFGFVVGEREGLLYIATARHVVVKYDDEEGVEVKASSVTARFYDDQGRSFNNVTILEIKKGDLDLSLLRIPKPNSISLTNGYFSPTMDIGEGVWFIGREREWKIPQSEGFISEEPQYDGTFEFESSTIKPGTSGAPLFTKNGIVGLIITDNQNTATAIHISFIEMLINNYNYPWFLKELFIPCIECPDGIIHWWPGDGDTRDIIGNNDGFINKNVKFVSGKVLQAFQFDGLNAYIETNESINIIGNTPRTIGMWIKSGKPYVGLTCCPTPFSWGATQKGGAFGIFVAVGKWFFWGFTEADMATTGVVDSIWNYHTITYNSTTVNYYINGEVVGSNPRMLNTGNSPLYLGRAIVPTTVGPTFFEGIIDEVQIFNRALEQKEILAIFKAGIGGVCKSGSRRIPKE